jgi:hypothetical protein
MQSIFKGELSYSVLFVKLFRNYFLVVTPESWEKKIIYIFAIKYLKNIDENDFY